LPPGVTARRLPLRGFSRRVPICVGPAGSYWFPAPSGLTFSRCPSVLPSPSLSSVARTEFTHPPSPPLQRLPLTLGSLSEAASFGVRSALIATSVSSVVYTAPSPFRAPSWSTGFQPVAVSVLGVSHALDGFFRYQPCGFISPRCHVQGSRSRGLFPRHSACRLVDDCCPLAGFSRLRYLHLAMQAPRKRSPSSGLRSMSRSALIHQSL
jgi:hypothetical protein